LLLLCTLWLVVALRLLRRDWAASNTRVWLAASAIVPLAVVVAVSALWITDYTREQDLTNALRDPTASTFVEVECQPVDEYLWFNEWYDAWAEPEARVAHLNYNLCADLSAYSASAAHRANPSSAQTYAMMALLKTAMFLEVGREVDVTHCEAAQYINVLAESLGATPEQARLAQASYYERTCGGPPPSQQ
jgi:hypothetical protein